MSNKPQKPEAQQFIDLVMQGMNCWIQAGEIAAQAIEENPNFIDDVCDKCPDITPEAVRRFQLIGIKKLHPQLAISETPGVRRLRKMPYEVQAKFVSQPIELLVKTADGWETLNVDVRNLTPDQAAQIFADDRLRSEAEQRAWLEDRKSKIAAPTVKATVPYRLSGKKLIVTQACTFTSRDLAQLLAEMER